jgi:menaquinone-dependent protoporphyrinogen IX oxidase
MKNILVAYTTNAGSTEEVARAIADELRSAGHRVDLARVEDAPAAAGYDAAIIGAPMIFGWHRGARRFVRRNRQALARIPTAYFCTLMALTSKPADPVASNVMVDPWLGTPPRNPQRLSLKERYATLANYLRPLRSAAPRVQPVSIGFFGGKLELFRLKWWQMLFVMVIVQARPGDLRNWDFIQAWAAGIAAQLEESP